MFIRACERACTLSRSVVSNSLQPPELQPSRLLCPWDSPGKNTGVGCNFLLQGIFLTQGLNPHLLYWQVDPLLLSHLGGPHVNVHSIIHKNQESRNNSSAHQLMKDTENVL